MSFFYCIATLLEFAGVHYFTKVGSGEVSMLHDEDEDVGAGTRNIIQDSQPTQNRSTAVCSNRKRPSIICPIYNVRFRCRKHSSTILRWNHSQLFLVLITFFTCFGEGSFRDVFIVGVSSLNYGANNTNRATAGEKVETNLVVFFGWWQVSKTTSARSNRKKFVLIRWFIFTIGDFDSSGGFQMLIYLLTNLYKYWICPNLNVAHCQIHILIQLNKKYDVHLFIYFLQ